MELNMAIILSDLKYNIYITGYIQIAEEHINGKWAILGKNSPILVYLNL